MRIARLSSASVTSGWKFGLLSDFHPEVTLAEDSRAMRIDNPSLRRRHLPRCRADPGAVGLRVAAPGGVARADPTRSSWTYAARGVARVWEGMETSRPEGDRLAALLGRSRATILTLVHIPMSTTQIARNLGQSAGSVNQHLAVLRESGMVTSWRSGRSVLYRQTALGGSLVAVNRAGEQTIRAVDSVDHRGLVTQPRNLTVFRYFFASGSDHLEAGLVVADVGKRSCERSGRVRPRRRRPRSEGVVRTGWPVSREGCLRDRLLVVVAGICVLTCTNVTTANGSSWAAMGILRTVRGQ